MTVTDVVLRVLGDLWPVATAGLIAMAGLVMLARFAQAGLAMGVGSGEAWQQALLGAVGPLVVVLFTFVAVPAALARIPQPSPCRDTLADLTRVAWYLLLAFVAFRYLRAAGAALVAQATGAAGAMRQFLLESTALLGIGLLVLFVQGVATILC